ARSTPNRPRRSPSSFATTAAATAISRSSVGAEGTTMRISILVALLGLLAFSTQAHAQSSCPGVPGFKYAAFGGVDVTIGGGATISVAGTAIVYIRTDLDIAGGGVVNPSQKSTDLVFFGGPGLTNVKVTGGASAAYAVYAPSADIATAGGAAIFGSLVGKTI